MVRLVSEEVCSTPAQPNFYPVLGIVGVLAVNERGTCSFQILQCGLSGV